MSTKAQLVDTETHDHDHASDLVAHLCARRGQRGSEQVSRQRQRRLAVVLALTATFMVVEFGVGLASGSLALVADAGHMLTDVVGIALALAAAWLARRPADSRHSYGHYRTEILAALVNAMLLFAVGGYILFESWQRWQDPPAVEGGPVLAAASVGLIINLIAIRVLHGHAHGNLNARAAMFEVVSDAASSVAVLVSGLLILLTGWQYADPLFSAVIALFILPRTFMLLREAVDVLLEATPRHLNMGAVESAILTVPGVHGVHDLHAWTLTSGVDALSAHVLVDDAIKQCPQTTLCTIQELLHDRFGVDHATLQLEEQDLQAQESHF